MTEMTACLVPLMEAGGWQEGIMIRTVIIRGNKCRKKRQIDGKRSGGHCPAASDFLREVGG